MNPIISAAELLATKEVRGLRVEGRDTYLVLEWKSKVTLIEPSWSVGEYKIRTGHWGGEENSHIFLEYSDSQVASLAEAVGFVEAFMSQILSNKTADSD